MKEINKKNDYINCLENAEEFTDAQKVAMGELVLKILRSEERQDVKVNVENLFKLIENLAMREKTVIRLRCGLEDGCEHTFRQIGEILGDISVERVRQIEFSGIKKLRDELKYFVIDNNLEGQDKNNPKLENSLITLKLNDKLCKDLNRANYDVHRLINTPDRELLKIEGVNKNGIKEIRKALERTGNCSFVKKDIPTMLSDLQFTTRTFNCLSKAGYDIPKLINATDNELAQIKGMGEKSVEEVKKVIKKLLDNKSFMKSEIPITLYDLDLSEITRKRLIKAGYDVAKLISCKNDEFAGIKGIDREECKEIHEAIKKII